MPTKNEAAVQRDIKKLAGFLAFHVSDTSQGYRPGGRGHGTTRITRGFPDLFLMHPIRRVHLFVEVKAQGGKPNPHQVGWHTVAHNSGVPCYVCDSLESFTEVLTRDFGFTITKT